LLESGSGLVIDSSLLYPGLEDYITGTEDILRYYIGRLWEIMKQYGIMDEQEILSGFVRKFSRKVSPKVGYLYVCMYLYIHIFICIYICAYILRFDLSLEISSNYPVSTIGH
jgi:hypothetical protein